MRSLRPRLVVLLGVLLGLTVLVPTASAGSGWLTPEPPAITLDAGVPAGSTVKAIVSSGEGFDAIEEWQGIPDGVGIKPGTGDTVDVYVAHEQTTVPFFGTADFENASVSHLTLDTTPGASMGQVLAAEVALTSSEGYLRFCSASMAGPAEGFSHYTFFTGEEANDIVDVTAGQPYGPDPALAPQRQAGYAVALNTETGHFDEILGMGRLNHENTIAVPGYDRIVLVTTDDTFSGPSAQLYMYLAADENAVWNDSGSLWAFRVTRDDGKQVKQNDPFNGANDYLDLDIGEVFSGEFIRVPKKIARGLTDEAPQQALENWSNENNVFQFIRLEDIAYDRNNPHRLYFADTGRSRVVPDPTTGRMARGPGGTIGQADSGRVFVMDINPNNPRKVDSLYVLADGDAPGSSAYVPFVSPDNLGTSANSLMVQEDADNAKIWRHDFTSGAWSVVATVNDPDGESSGIVDASAWFGEGAWLLTVQGHGTRVREEPQPDGTLLKLESGQLLLMKIPGS